MTSSICISQTDPNRWDIDKVKTNAKGEEKHRVSIGYIAQTKGRVLIAFSRNQYVRQSLTFDRHRDAFEFMNQQLRLNLPNPFIPEERGTYEISYKNAA